MDKKNECIYTVQIDDKQKIGLHARPVAKIVAGAGQYKDSTQVTVYKLDENVDITKEIKLTGNEPKANGLSILSVIGLGVKNKNKIAFVAKGPHCKEVIENVKIILKQEKLIT